MLELASAAGTTDIVATPHADGQFAFDPKTIETRIAELSARVPGITIHRGCDFHLQVNNIEDALAHPSKYTVNHRGYLLVEFPHMTVFPGSTGILLRLLGAGMTPIVTHPERNAHLQRHPDELARWVDAGCLAQVTAASCTGHFGRRVKACADDLMSRQLVHFIASDAHDVDHRPPDLRQAYAQLVKEWGEARVRPLFVDNPRAVLRGEEIEATVAQSVRKPGKWYQFWR
jgi:protein-tyrosine phosphatase